MTRPTFATYLYSQTCATSRPVDQIEFAGHSLPHFSQVRQALAVALSHYPALPLRQADYLEYGRVHSTDYLQTLSRMAAGEAVEEPPRLSLECLGYEYCLPGYQYGLGGLLVAIEQMKAGNLERAYCFSLGGHHAHHDWGHGYCLLNPVAAAARYAQALGFGRVLLVDWDVHHGDGTQAIFAHETSVYCLSIHSAVDLYMSLQGVLREGTTTQAEAVGHCNIPLLSRSFGDDFFEQINLSGCFYRAEESLPAFETALTQVPWSPELILIFSGYDAHRDDCGQGITDWTEVAFRHLTELVLTLAQKVACPVLSVHGGGYNLPVTISAARSHIETLASYT
jgi:acetoin utilization deacetylase AcuC-like enzyme